jgi:hypothetical protein
MLINIVIENERSRPPSTEELADWAEEHGMSFPVLSDEEGVIWSYAEGGSVALPFKILMDDGVEIVSKNPRDRDIEATLD